MSSFNLALCTLSNIYLDPLIILICKPVEAQLYLVRGFKQCLCTVRGSNWSLHRKENFQMGYFLRPGFGHVSETGGHEAM